MLTTAQILLIVVVVILTVLLTLIGIQVYQVLLEFKKVKFRRILVALLLISLPCCRV